MTEECVSHAQRSSAVYCESAKFVGWNYSQSTSRTRDDSFFRELWYLVSQRSAVFAGRQYRRELSGSPRDLAIRPDYLATRVAPGEWRHCSYFLAPGWLAKLVRHVGRMYAPVVTLNSANPLARYYPRLRIRIDGRSRIMARTDFCQKHFVKSTASHLCLYVINCRNYKSSRSLISNRFNFFFLLPPLASGTVGAANEM